MPPDPPRSSPPCLVEQGMSAATLCQPPRTRRARAHYGPGGVNAGLIGASDHSSGTVTGPVASLTDVAEIRLLNQSGVDKPSTR